MARAFVILSCSLVVLLSSDGSAQQRTSAPRQFPAELDRYIDHVRRAWSIPGIAVAVVRNDTTLIAKGYGVRELGQTDLVDSNTAFDIGSLTMAFTATAVGMLVDRGVLRWNDPVRRWLPGLVLPTDTLTALVTVRDFLSHRTGLEPANTMWASAALSRDELMRRMRAVRSLGPFRRTMVPSNIGYAVAGEAAAAAARTPFEQLLRDVLVAPLQLESTTLTYDQPSRTPNMAAPHAMIGSNQQVLARNREREPVAAALGLQSTANDLARWMRLHLNRGRLDGRRHLSDSVVHAMHSIQVPIRMTPAQRTARLMRDSLTGYGMGWQIADYRGHRMLWHTGDSDGHSAYVALFPDDGLGVLVMVNTISAAGATGALVNRIADAYLATETRDWAAEALARRAAADSGRAALRHALLAMRSSAPAPASLGAYTGRYDHAAFGPIWVRRERNGLTLQVGEGRTGDLEYHGRNAFYLIWRDPLHREFNGAHVDFTMGDDSAVAVTTVINRDLFTARKAWGATVAARRPRPDLTGVESIVGRWNLRLLGRASANEIYSSWLEIQRSGFENLVGRFVGLIGGARPIGRVDWIPNPAVARFNVATEWEGVGADWDITTRDLQLEVRPSGDSITGVIIWPAGGMRAFVGRRAPSLAREIPASWTTPTPLLNGKDLSGWIAASTAGSLPNRWSVRDGILVNTAAAGANLMTTQKFQDFKLHMEFRYPKRGDSGVFLRGRYEVQIADDEEREWPSAATTGAVYGFHIPNQNAATAADTWQSMDITLVGRRVTVAVNGKMVVGDQIIPGITGSALDADEAAPGPIMLQGEETSVEFRNLTISVPSKGAEEQAPASGAAVCAVDDNAAANAVRARLNEWVRQANADDQRGMREVWAPGVVGWFPGAALFSDSAALAAAGVTLPASGGPVRTTYNLVLDDVVAAGSTVVVHDIWTETREIAGKKVQRTIRGSELWRCQSDARWRISRYVSAPEPWLAVQN